uniref:Fumarate lyase N-terminal domain-containing protein n=1 Tax=Aegilops tauschii subsp. strangulata TaxID=200361 RepID=A0A453I844_AEGTS
QMSAPMDWAARSVGELEQATDLDTFCMMALSPLDGRYFRFIKDLMPFFSEFGLIRYRVLVEVKWLLKLSQIPEVKEVLEFFHFGCTSEDINNLSHALALKEGVNTVMFPVMIDVCSAICSLATENAHVPLLSKTHGQCEINEYLNYCFFISI